MKKLIVVLGMAGLLGLPTAGSASTCASLVSVDVTTIGSCTAGNLTFSHFVVTDTTGTPGPVDLVTVAAGGPNEIDFTYNPNLFNSQDLWFFFQVAGPLDGVDLSDAGTGITSIGERVCSSALGVDNLCPSGTLLALLNVNTTINHDSASFSTVNQAYIFKDIGTSRDGAISSFTQSFHTPPVPEPASMLLLGTGLLGIGRRRWMARKQ